MTDISLLVGASAVGGFALGCYRLHWFALAIAGFVVAIGGAAVLQGHGFEFVPGVAIIAGCLTVNQLSYLVGAALMMFARDDFGADLTGDQPDHPPGEGGERHVAGEHQQYDQAPLRPHPPEN